jgi:hypothetical protein
MLKLVNIVYFPRGFFATCGYKRSIGWYELRLSLWYCVIPVLSSLLNPFLLHIANGTRHKEDDRLRWKGKISMCLHGALDLSVHSNMAPALLPIVFFGLAARNRIEIQFMFSSYEKVVGNVSWRLSLWSFRNKKISTEKDDACLH